MIIQGDCTDNSPCGQLVEHLKNLEISDNIVFDKTYPVDDHSQLRNIKIDKNKKGVIIWVTDNSIPVGLDNNITLFRTSLDRNNTSSNEYAFPWCSPIRKEHFSPIFKELSIGFCGFDAHEERREAIDWFEKSNLKTNFLRRSKFIRGFSKEQQKQYRYIDYPKIMKENIFNLCPRGAGNWSLRFYETMHYGRIPILLNRNMVLPFEDIINWEDTVIMSDSLKELEHKVVSWYNKGKDFLIDRQENCKYIYDKYLSMKGFANHFLRYVV